jgi:hypothetical protein
MKQVLPLSIPRISKQNFLKFIFTNFNQKQKTNHSTSFPQLVESWHININDFQTHN